LAQIINDPERSLLLGGVGAITLSAKEAAARSDGKALYASYVKHP
jgi:hypothetical protein